jgi:cytochrome c oxidase assembly factor CtaG
MLLHVELPLELAGPAVMTIGLALGGSIYTAGWRHYGSRMPGRSAASRLACFLGGLGCLWVALASPLDEAADTLLSAHMVQHIVLLTVSPALLLLGDPLLPLLRGLPNSLRRTVVAPLRWRLLRRALHALTHPLVGLLLSSVAFWSWHSPELYQLALRVPAIHLVEHASFFVAGVLFWYPVVQPWPTRPRWPSGAMIPYLLIADAQNTMLAAIFTFSDRVLYPLYELHDKGGVAAALGDQVLAGVVMWVPMSLAYLVPAVLLTVRLLSPATNRVNDGASRRSVREPTPLYAEPAG